MVTVALTSIWVGPPRAGVTEHMVFGRETAIPATIGPRNARERHGTGNAISRTGDGRFNEVAILGSFGVEKRCSSASVSPSGDIR